MTNGSDYGTIRWILCPLVSLATFAAAHGQNPPCVTPECKAVESLISQVGVFANLDGALVDGVLDYMIDESAVEQDCQCPFESAQSSGFVSYTLDADLWRLRSSVTAGEHKVIDSDLALSSTAFQHLDKRNNMLSVKAGGFSGDLGLVAPNPLFILAQFISDDMEDSQAEYMTADVIRQNSQALLMDLTLNPPVATQVNDKSVISIGRDSFQGIEFTYRLTYAHSPDPLLVKIERVTIDDDEVLTSTSLSDHAPVDAPLGSVMMPMTIKYDVYDIETEDPVVTLMIGLTKLELPTGAEKSTQESDFVIDPSSAAGIWSDDLNSFVQ